MKAFVFEYNNDTFETCIKIANIMANLKIDKKKGVDYITEIAIINNINVSSNFNSINSK